MSNLQPIETRYNGYRFRSRLEARWAVAFDAMGIEYEYEPEGYNLGGGIRYLPDFYLRNVQTRSGKGLWVEVKGVLEEEDARKIRLFSGEEPISDNIIYDRELCTIEELYSRTNRIIVIGQIPEFKFGFARTDESDDYYWTFRFIDGDWYTGTFSEHEGKIWFCGVDHDEYDGGRLMKIGIDAAKQARFEYESRGGY